MTGHVDPRAEPVTKAIALAFPYLDFSPDDPLDMGVLDALVAVVLHAVDGEMPEQDGWGSPWV